MCLVLHPKISTIIAPFIKLEFIVPFVIEINWNKKNQMTFWAILIWYWSNLIIRIKNSPDLHSGEEKPESLVATVAGDGRKGRLPWCRQLGCEQQWSGLPGGGRKHFTMSGLNGFQGREVSMATNIKDRSYRWRSRGISGDSVMWL